MTQTQDIASKAVDAVNLISGAVSDLDDEVERLRAENERLQEYRDRFLAYWHSDDCADEFHEHMQVLHDDMDCELCAVETLLDNDT